jgi:rhodanese-related sulfurtransferase
MSLLSRLLRRPAAEAPAWIEAETLASRLAANRPPLVIDVRGPDEFAGPLGHIVQATNLPLPELPVHLGELIARKQPLVLVCKTDRRSSAAAAQLRAAGAADVTVLRGGMERWRALGLP